MHKQKRLHAGNFFFSWGMSRILNCFQDKMPPQEQIQLEKHSIYCRQQEITLMISWRQLFFRTNHRYLIYHYSHLPIALIIIHTNRNIAVSWSVFLLENLSFETRNFDFLRAGPVYREVEDPRTYILLFLLDHVEMIGEVALQGSGSPPGIVNLSAGVAFLHVDVSKCVPNITRLAGPGSSSSYNCKLCELLDRHSALTVNNSSWNASKSCVA